jgi:NADPH:quinone reductase-like Zn-dependent oxidoreductase
MKTWVIHTSEPSDPEPSAAFPGLRVSHRPPAPLGSSDVRVRVRAVSLNFRDLSIARRRARDVVVASDGAGDVIEVGSAVTRWKVGDAVMGSFFPHWVDGELGDRDHQTALGGGGDGMLAEEVVLPDHSWVRAPLGWSHAEAATLPCAGLTAWQALFEVAATRPGDTVLVQGSGGVSVFALQLAKRAGARVIATTSRPDKADRLRSLGADEILDYKQEPKWGKKAYALAGGRGVDVVVDVGGPGTFDESIAALRYGGTISLLGVLTGVRGDVNLYGLFHKRLVVRGVYVGSVRMFERFVAALEATAIRPVIDRVFPFDQAALAYEHLASQEHLGKVVIEV